MQKAENKQKSSFLARTKKFVEKKKNWYKQLEQRVLQGVHNVEIIVLLGIVALTATFAVWFPTNTDQQYGVFVNGTDSNITTTTRIISTNSNIINVGGVRVDFFGDTNLSSHITSVTSIVRHSTDPNTGEPTIDNIRLNIEGSDDLSNEAILGIKVSLDGNLLLENNPSRERITLNINGTNVSRRDLRDAKKVAVYLNGNIAWGNPAIGFTSNPIQPDGRDETNGTDYENDTDDTDIDTPTDDNTVQLPGGNTTVPSTQIPLQAQMQMTPMGAMINLSSPLGTNIDNARLMGRSFSTQSDGTLVTTDYNLQLVMQSPDGSMPRSFDVVRVLPIAGGKTSTQYMVMGQSSDGLMQQFIMSANPISPNEFAVQFRSADDPTSTSDRNVDLVARLSNSDDPTSTSDRNVDLVARLSNSDDPTSTTDRQFSASN